jgi:hypothetical protein
MKLQASKAAIEAAAKVMEEQKQQTGVGFMGPTPFDLAAEVLSAALSIPGAVVGGVGEMLFGESEYHYHQRMAHEAHMREEHERHEHHEHRHHEHQDPESEHPDEQGGEPEGERDRR